MSDMVSTGAIESLLARRSASPRRLGLPGPTPAQLDLVLQAGLRAPDHGSLTPWRVINFPQAGRHQLADLFAAEKLRRDPLASTKDLERARAHALEAPLLLAFVVCIRAGVTVPVSEQWLAAGAALGNMLNAFHALDFGAVILSGDRCSDIELNRRLGVRDSEKLAGFISVGTVAKTPRPLPRKPYEAVLSDWPGGPDIDSTIEAPTDADHADDRAEPHRAGSGSSPGPVRR